MHEKPGTVIVTGSAGFIGSFVCNSFLNEGWHVIGIDCMSDYYDVRLKEARERRLSNFENFRKIHAKIEDPQLLRDVFKEECPDVVIHLAAQAGVRYSMENPRSYLESNIIGTFELLEAARAYPPKHMLLASSSSAYGANTEMPFRETAKSDHQMSFYAATKKSTEIFAHSYAHLYDLPITMFRFFTVYGPWGRPDMALFTFTQAILENRPIDVYNYGDMKRDFTYIDDLVSSIRQLVEKPPVRPTAGEVTSGDSLSPVAPFRCVNIGNSNAVQLTDFIDAIEDAIGSKSHRNLMSMQPGDVKSTWADTSLLKSLTGGSPETSVKDGVGQFVSWYRDFYNV